MTHPSPISPTIIIGIDPGKTGALAIVSAPSGGATAQSFPSRFELTQVHDMPINQNGDVDAFKLSKIVSQTTELTPITAAIVEDVSAMTYTALIEGKRVVRGQGAAASFSFGRSVGVLHGVLAAHRIPIFLVRPAVWKLALGLTSDKASSLELASRTFPEAKHLWPLKKHDGRAEAALLAFYGLRNLSSLF